MYNSFTYLNNYEGNIMITFTAKQTEILNLASEWFDLATDQNMYGDRKKAMESMAQYHKLTDQVLEETGCALWEIITAMSGVEETPEIPGFEGTTEALNNLGAH